MKNNTVTLGSLYFHIWESNPLGKRTPEFQKPFNKSADRIKGSQTVAGGTETETGSAGAVPCSLVPGMEGVEVVGRLRLNPTPSSPICSKNGVKI